MEMDKSKDYHDLIILYSGGADSRLMLEFALKQNKNPYCVLINYSQQHNQELEFAKKQLQKQYIDYQIVEINGLNLNSALTGNLIPGRFGPQVSEWHVPGRNTIFVSIAFSIAENMGIEEIWLGADYSDIENGFVDCKQDFINKTNELFQVNGSYPIKLRAPLLGLEKESVKKLLEDFGVLQSEIFSGYGDLEVWDSGSSDIPPGCVGLYVDEGLKFSDNISNKDLSIIQMTYRHYINLLVLSTKADCFIPAGTYRLEGHDPLSNEYGIVYIFDRGINSYIENPDNFKYCCQIVDIDDWIGGK